MTPRRRNLAAGLALIAAAGIAVAVVLVMRTSTTVPRASLAAEAGGQPGQTAPDFTAPSTAGSFRLASARGSPVVLGFVQAGCGSCAADLRSFSSLAPGHPSARFIGVNMPGGGTAQDLASFGQSLGVSGITYVADGSGAVSADYRITEVDTVVVLDPGGRVVWRGTAPSTDDLAAALTRAGA